jgi:acetyl esterase/lipase
MDWLTIVLLIALSVAAAGVIVYVARASVLDLITSRAGYTVLRDIAFAAQSPRQKLDLYVPAQRADTAPLLVFFYGSDWTHGSKRIYRFLAQPFASRGIVVAVPDYRMFPETTFPGFVEDGARAVAKLWETRRMPDGSPRPLILMGHSAGAHTAALLATDRSFLAAVGVPHDAVKAVIGVSGAYDFLPFTQAKYEPIFPLPARTRSQPIDHVDGREPPMLLLVGDPDLKLDAGNTFRFAKRIEEKGGRVTVKVYPGVSHAAMITALAEALPVNKPPVRDDILAFLRSVLGRDFAAPGQVPR